MKSINTMHTKGLRTICPHTLPHTTYRIQFHKDFNFNALESILPYLHELGVDTIYASPIMRSTPGSMHGYDGTDMQQIDPEVGTVADLRRIRKQLNLYGIKWLQDIVPNHMAFHPDNAWLMDLLEFGPTSAHTSFFDTCFFGSMFEPGKLIVPILAKEVHEAIDDGEITVALVEKRLYLKYFDNCYPLSPESYCTVLEDHLRKVKNDFSGFLVQVNTAQANGNQQEWQTLRNEILADISDTDLQNYLNAVNNTKYRLEELIETQFYELCPWWTTNHRINYRRFFTVNGLICINVQHPVVFRETHRLIKELIEEKLIDGLRIDHIDGLYNPNQYLKDLRDYVGPDIYIVVEKILERNEDLPQIWPIQGTTGYEFLSACNNLITCAKGKKQFDFYYDQLTGNKPPLKKQQLNKKMQILTKYMQGDVDNLVNLLMRLLDDSIGVDRQHLTAVLQTFLANFPVYRIYDDNFPLSAASYRMIEDLFELIKKDHSLNKQAIKQFFCLFSDAQEGRNPTRIPETIRLLKRCMQFAGPAMAKGVEDTLMYTYNRFIGHNEVGDHPGNFGISIKNFHRLMQKRQTHWPLSLNTTATHDTKRGDDTRSRLAVLTAMPNKWVKQVQIWQDIVWNEYRGDLPHPNDEYFIYQALLGSYPLGAQEKATDSEFETRFLDYLIKYLREGKERSSWEEPNESYESAVRNFASFLLNKERPFFTSFYQFLQRISDFGIINSLAQQLLKFTCPGVPDIYQGTELWNHSFVDPDNRRAVDYGRCKELLAQIAKIPEDVLVKTLWRERYDGKIKLWLVHKLAKLRKSHPALSFSSSYIKLKVKGAYKKNILAFARKCGDDWLVIVIPLHLAELRKFSQFIPGNFAWDDTRILLPTNRPLKWEHLLSNVEGEETEIGIDKLFSDLPLAIIKYKNEPKKRSAGILMHISSLPSPYGIGDLGKEARRFVRQLQASGQSWWQMLPLGPTAEAQCHSPYSTLSAWAGNPLFIDLEGLAKIDLLTEEELHAVKRPYSNEINFQEVSSIKYRLLKMAYSRSSVEEETAFVTFCSDESNWLEDFACFTLLKDKHDNLPWYKWPEEYKLRDKEALNMFKSEHMADIQMIKWWQYVFYHQWKELHHYCGDHGIRLLGDIPFYVNYDSADVWANPQFFTLDQAGCMTKVAGVPPDYFNDQGQLWGMPVYQWEVLKRDGYQWWVGRLRHYCKLFDQSRLDHFRAFSSFWQVPAEEQSAKHGAWSPGPGADFFGYVKTELEQMPFVAEDLGDVDSAVYALRDQFGMPGMKVLQFAFGEDMPRSPHIPHQYGQNFVAYTGTHDNNTLLSWYNQDIDRSTRNRIDHFIGTSIDASNINKAFIRLLYASIVDTVIIPMQDILELDGSCRMNKPASTAGNWLWRMKKQAFQKNVQKQLWQYTQLYNR